MITVQLDTGSGATEKEKEKERCIQFRSIFLSPGYYCTVGEGWEKGNLSIRATKRPADEEICSNFSFPPATHPPPSSDPYAANWEREREREEERDTLFTKVRYFPRARLLPVLSLDPLPATIQNVCGSLTFFLNVRCKSSKI